MVKILEQPENQKSAMMDSRHEGQSVGSSSGVCNWAGEPGVAPPGRVSGCGEPNSPRPPASKAAPVGSRVTHTCGDRKAARAESSGEGGLRGQTRHDSRLVPAAYRPQVRWFAIPYVSWPTPDFSYGGGTGGSLRPRELGLGLRPHRGGAGQPGSSDFGPDCGQYPTPQ